MTIEINRNTEYTYRISPTDPLLIERRENKHGARWCWYAHRDTPNEAKAALLQLEPSK